MKVHAIFANIAPGYGLKMTNYTKDKFQGFWYYMWMSFMDNNTVVSTL